ncbi:hypothetical protein JCM16303_005011 [Sporobolomyces ruberrimus]
MEVVISPRAKGRPPPLHQQERFQAKQEIAEQADHNGTFAPIHNRVSAHPGSFRGAPSQPELPRGPTPSTISSVPSGSDFLPRKSMGPSFVQHTAQDPSPYRQFVPPSYLPQFPLPFPPSAPIAHEPSRSRNTSVAPFPSSTLESQPYTPSSFRSLARPLPHPTLYSSPAPLPHSTFQPTPAASTSSSSPASNIIRQGSFESFAGPSFSNSSRIDEESFHRFRVRVEGGTGRKKFASILNRDDDDQEEWGGKNKVELNVKGAAKRGDGKAKESGREKEMDREKTETLSLEEDDEIVIVEPIAESKEERMVLEKQVREEESGLPLPLEEEGVGQAVAPVAASELVVEERTAVGPREGVVKPASVDGKGEESRPTKRRKVSVEPPRDPVPSASLANPVSTPSSKEPVSSADVEMAPPASMNEEVAVAPTAQEQDTNPRQVGLDLPPGWILQTSRCANVLTKRGANAGGSTKPARSIEDAVYRRPCRECKRRQTGFQCGFIGLRAFRQLPDGTIDPRQSYFRTAPDVVPDFPSGSDFNEPFTPAEANVLKSIAADKLALVMRKELEHASLPRARRLARDVSIVNNCDTCLHIMMCGSWICDNCAREVCFDCHSTMLAIEAKERGERDPPELEGLAKVTLDKLVQCHNKMVNHRTSDFTPLTRMDVEKLDRTVKGMEAWKEEHPIEKPKELPEGWLDQFSFQPREEENSLPYLVLPSDLLRSTAETVQTLDPVPPILNETHATDDPFDSLRPPPNSTLTHPPGFSTIDLFRSIWSRGEALVVDLPLSEISTIDWSPEYFIEHFRNEKVTIASNLPMRGDRVKTVGQFFRSFGRQDGFENSEKIKDWPPSTDFRKSFPDLWRDFMNMLPIGSVTRRDGVLNISTHTPHNANPPDLGPKGYFSEISDDTEGGQGSTKLHSDLSISLFLIPQASLTFVLAHSGSLSIASEDVADAVNVLLWASDGIELTKGFAVWDLFRAEDADKIREFLYELTAERLYRGDLERAKQKTDDPIHTQRYFLDQKLRKELWEKKGVKSWRIHQKPGQVVFIPAGCAHQVCNFADCIKVASDFVSVENVGRCWKVTDEFRQQTKEEKLWRSDVLGLKCQLLWAWESASRLDETA